MGEEGWGGGAAALHGHTKTRPRWAAGASSAWRPRARRRPMVRRPWLAAGGCGDDRLGKADGERQRCGRERPSRKREKQGQVTGWMMDGDAMRCRMWVTAVQYLAVSGPSVTAPTQWVDGTLAGVEMRCAVPSGAHSHGIRGSMGSIPSHPIHLPIPLIHPLCRRLRSPVRTLARRDARRGQPTPSSPQGDPRRSCKADVFLMQTRRRPSSPLRPPPSPRCPSSLPTRHSVRRIGDHCALGARLLAWPNLATLLSALSVGTYRPVSLRRQAVPKVSEQPASEQAMDSHHHYHR